MSNEPVAWMSQGGDVSRSADYFVEMGFTDLIPLYTHPVKYCPSESNEAYEKGFIDGMAKMTESAVHRAVEGMAVKELTDEEILEVANEFPFIENGIERCKFARAILRKAQEK
jgi:hypothetical protein